MSRFLSILGRCALALAFSLTANIALVPPLQAQSPRSASSVRPTQPGVLVEIERLNGAMPTSFAFVPSDPCSGIWDIRENDGTAAMKITVFRYRNVPLMHISGNGFGQSNHAAIRIDPRSIRTPGSIDGILLRCAGNRGVLETTSVASETRRFEATRGLPEQTAAPAQRSKTKQARVQAVAGNIQYIDVTDTVHRITQGGGNADPVLSPDGQSVAFIHIDRKPTEEGDSALTSLWLGNLQTGGTRRLLASTPDAEEKRNLASFGEPRFSLDGGFVYINAEAWVTSAAVHQISVATGNERFVVAGGLMGIIRTGKYRGYLLVSQHRYRSKPRSGSYDPVYVVRPDGKEELLVPGTDGDDDANSHVAAWLDSNGWQAW